MQKISLNGEWTLKQQGKEESIPATVPGCVHTDLLQNGKIDDPYDRDNEKQVLWIGETDWNYQKVFKVPAELLEFDRVSLNCQGLDTLATILINGKEIGNTDNMFRTWEFDVKSVLKEGKNKIKVHFDAPMPYVREREKEFTLPAWGVGDHKLTGGGWIRKEPCNFGWDWGPMLATCGIWRDIELVGFNTARIDNIHILQDHSSASTVGLEIKTEVEKLVEEELTVAYKITLDDQVITEKKKPFIARNTKIKIDIEDPELWWPNGMGEQPLYRVEITLSDETGTELDKVTKKIGLRTLKLERERDEWGESFRFSVNGKSFFAKGANWIPAETFAPALRREDYARLLQDTVDANMNMLRVWGGGIYEDDDFYELCDELGICVWQDFIFACATYPAFDQDFMENVKIEAEENLKRIRHHACLALWCGNNELEQGLVGEEWSEEKCQMSWEDYSKLFDSLLPELVEKLDPQRDYWPSSEHSPLGNREDSQNPKWGDAHLWDVWHGKKPFEWYRTCEHRFNSEFGFQSFPEPKTVYGYTVPEDHNITSYVMEHHQRSGIGNTTIMTYMLDWFRLPTSFEMVLWASQILQGMAIKYAVEHWRRSMPRGMGTLYWQLNDCWPVASWSSIDYHGRWKALHYMARKFYAPLLVSGLEDMEDGTVEIHVTSDLLQDKEGTVSWLLTDVAGKEIMKGSKQVAIPERKNVCVETLDLQEYLADYGNRNLMLWLELEVEDDTVSSNFVSFARPKHLDLQEPEIAWDVQAKEGGEFLVELKAKKPTLWTWIELTDNDARYSDNFFHLVPGNSKGVTVKPAEKITAEELRNSLKVRSLIDTY